MSENSSENNNANDSQATIKAQPNSALVLKGEVALTDAEGKVLETKAVAALCRCGASKNKPFCDGSHNAIGFDDALSDERTRDHVYDYVGEHISVHYNKLLCCHAAVCGKSLSKVFDSSKRPWISPDNASIEEVKSVVKGCPSGALRYSENGQAPQQLTDNESSVRIFKNGPYLVSNVTLEEANLAEGATQEKYVLCRCGASKNKPYCDGSHADITWDDSQ